MRLTEQQRAELERRRFRPVPISDDGVVIVDYVGQRQWYIGPGDGELAYRRAMELAAVLGIAPPGYRLVPERLADSHRGIPLTLEAVQTVILDVANEHGQPPGYPSHLHFAMDVLARLRQQMGGEQ